MLQSCEALEIVNKYSNTGHAQTARNNISEKCIIFGQLVGPHPPVAFARNINEQFYSPEFPLKIFLRMVC